MRIAHPWRPPVCALFVAGVSWREAHVLPPSVLRANSTGSLPAVPRKPTLHTYTFPKNGLDEALSAQICSLSLNSAPFCLVTITGGIHAAFPAVPPAAAAATLSVRDTAIAASPLNALGSNLVAMLA